MCAIKGEAVRMSADLIRWTGGPGDRVVKQLMPPVLYSCQVLDGA